MYILGINAYHPNSCACIIKDGLLLAAVEEERFLRVKHWAGFPKESIRYCLKIAGIGLEGLDYIALNRQPLANLYKKAAFIVLNRPSFSLLKDRAANMFKVGGLRPILTKEFLAPGEKLKAGIYHIEHHRAHCASSFFVSPFKEAAALSIDGSGDFTTCMLAKAKENKIKVLSAVNYPHSLGLFYTAFSQFLGFKEFGSEYKTMELSVQAKPAYADKMKEILILKPGGKFMLNLSYFSFYRKTSAMLWNNTQPRITDLFSGKLIEKFGRPRNNNEEISGFYAELAASVQKRFEEALFHILDYAYKISGISNLCLAGGCALNRVATRKIPEETPFKEIYIPALASDAGGAGGAAYYLWYQILNKPRYTPTQD